MSIVATFGTSPYDLYASEHLECVLVGRGMPFENDVTFGPIATRKVDPEYLAWLRVNNKATKEKQAKFAEACKQYIHDVLAVRQECPHGYHGPVALVPH